MVSYIFLALQTVHQAYAVPPCLPRSDLLGDLAAVNAPLKVNQVDEADRKTAKDYAAAHNATEDEIKHRYAATGDLDCGNGKSQANVTLVGDVITTSAHSLGGGKKCVDPKKTPKCSFTVEIDGQKATYETSALVDSGWTCGYPDITTPGTDWAVLRLNKKVDPKIKPYAIDRDYELKMKTNSPVVAVGKSADFPDAKALDLFEHPRHYGDCQTKQPVGTGVLTNCDISPGDSGGALVTPGPNPTLVGVHMQEVIGGTGCPKANWAKHTGAYSMCWATMSGLVNGDFATAVERAAKLSGRK